VCGGEGGMWELGKEIGEGAPFLPHPLTPRAENFFVGD